MKRVKSVVVLLIVMVLVLQLGLHMAAAKDVVTMNIGSDPRSVDPALASTTNEHVLVNQLFEGLTRQGPEGIVPGVAREWSFDQTPIRTHLSSGTPNFPTEIPSRLRTLCIPGRGPWIPELDQNMLTSSTTLREPKP